jgi:hypothetical protein
MFEITLTFEWGNMVDAISAIDIAFWLIDVTQQTYL